MCGRFWRDAGTGVTHVDPDEAALPYANHAHRSAWRCVVEGIADEIGQHAPDPAHIERRDAHVLTGAVECDPAAGGQWPERLERVREQVADLGCGGLEGQTAGIQLRELQTDRRSGSTATRMSRWAVAR